MNTTVNTTTGGWKEAYLSVIKSNASITSRLTTFSSYSTVGGNIKILYTSGTDTQDVKKAPPSAPTSNTTKNFNINKVLCYGLIIQIVLYHFL